MNGASGSEQAPIILTPDFLDADFLDFDIQYGVNLRLGPEVKENYQKTFRLTLDDRGPGFIDATGEWHPIPAETTLITMRTITEFFPGLDARTYIQHILIFSDAEHNTLLRLPSYGWPFGELQQFCARAGWDTDLSNERIKGEHSEKLFKGISKSPVAEVSGPLTDGTIIAKHIRHLIGRFKRDKQDDDS